MNTSLASIVARKSAVISLPTYQSFVEGKKPKAEKPETYFGGYHVYGLDPDDVAAHHGAFKKQSIHAAGAGLPAPKFRKLSPKKLSTKPFSLEESANQFSQMCRDAGKVGVFVKKLVPKQKKAESAG